MNPHATCLLLSTTSRRRSARHLAPGFRLYRARNLPSVRDVDHFSLFRDRFAEACRVRGMKPDAVYRSIGIGGRRALDLQSVGVLRALDLYRVCQIADRLDVSLDWLLDALT